MPPRAQVLIRHKRAGAAHPRADPLPADAPAAGRAAAPRRQGAAGRARLSRHGRPARRRGRPGGARSLSPCQALGVLCSSYHVNAHACMHKAGCFLDIKAQLPLRLVLPASRGGRCVDCVFRTLAFSCGHNSKSCVGHPGDLPARAAAGLAAGSARHQAVQQGQGCPPGRGQPRGPQGAAVKFPAAVRPRQAHPMMSLMTISLLSARCYQLRPLNQVFGLLKQAHRLLYTTSGLRCWLAG